VGKTGFARAAHTMDPPQKRAFGDPGKVLRRFERSEEQGEADKVKCRKPKVFRQEGTDTISVLKKEGTLC